uniref:Uncharacterized protein n=1 Tax=Anopheles farauti TaxID=69004 RepID=A0A182QWJ5_9DIPT
MASEALALDVLDPVADLAHIVERRSDRAGSVAQDGRTDAVDVLVAVDRVADLRTERFATAQHLQAVQVARWLGLGQWLGQRLRQRLGQRLRLRNDRQGRGQDRLGRDHRWVRIGNRATDGILPLGAHLAAGIEQRTSRALEVDGTRYRALVEAATVAGVDQQRGHRAVDASRDGVLDARRFRLQRGSQNVRRDVAGLAAHLVGGVTGQSARVEQGVVRAGEQDRAAGAAHEELLAVDRIRHQLTGGLAELQARQHKGTRSSSAKIRTSVHSSKLTCALAAAIKAANIRKRCILVVYSFTVTPGFLKGGARFPAGSSVTVSVTDHWSNSHVRAADKQTRLLCATATPKQGRDVTKRTLRYRNLGLWESDIQFRRTQGGRKLQTVCSATKAEAIVDFSDSVAITFKLAKRARAGETSQSLQPPD